MVQRWGVNMELKIIVEKHPEGYVAYPLGLKGVVVGEGDTYEEAYLLNLIIYMPKKPGVINI